MYGIVSAVVPVLLLVVCCVAPVAFVLWLRTRARRGRRSPLTAKLLRGPGTTLREEIDDATGNIGAYLAVLAALPLLILAMHLSQSYIGGRPESVLRTTVNSLFVIGLMLYGSYRLYQDYQRRFRLTCALDAEIAVAQELDQLMRQGAIAFHDLPAEEFNIDHVVVTRGGVIAVETKSRLKPDRGGGAEDATVTFDGQALLFPGWKDTETLAQTRRQAKWLARWLTSAAGTTVEVSPVVALPGWFVDRRAKSDVRVISGREAKSLMLGWHGAVVSDEMMNRIAHQLEERCRNVEPVQYGRANRLGRLRPERA